MQYLKKISQFSIGPLIGAFFSFITIPIITYFIAPIEYGKVSMFTLMQSILGMLVYLGMDQAYIKYYNETDDKDNLLLNAISPAILLSFCIGIVVFVFQREISDWLFGTPNETLCIILLVTYLPFVVCERFFLIYVRMQEKGLQFSALSIIVKFFTLVFSIVFLFYFEKSFRSIIYATVIAQIIGSICISFSVLRKFNFKHFCLNKNMLISMFKFGFPLVPATLIGWVLNSMDKIMIRGMCGYEQLGLYSAALKIVSILTIIQSCFSTFWTPVAFRWNKENKGIWRFEVVGHTLLCLMTIIMILILTFKNLIIHILSPDYVQSVTILPFLLLSPIMQTISEVTVVGIYFTGRSLYTVIVAIGGCIVNIVLNGLLIPDFGAIGASIATGISYITFFWLRTIISTKIWKKIHVSDYFYYNIFLIVLCILNIYIKNNMINIINILCLIIIIVINVPFFKKIINIYLQKEK